MAYCNWCTIKVVSVMDLGESDVSTLCVGRYHPAYRVGGDVASIKQDMLVVTKNVYVPKKKKNVCDVSVSVTM